MPIIPASTTRSGPRGTDLDVNISRASVEVMLLQSTYISSLEYWTMDATFQQAADEALKAMKACSAKARSDKSCSMQRMSQPMERWVVRSRYLSILFKESLEVNFDDCIGA